MRIRTKEIGTCNLVGKQVEQRRKELEMKQKDLLIQLQMRGVELNPSGLSKLEGQLRKVSDFELVALADILGVSILWLLDMEE